MNYINIYSIMNYINIYSIMNYINLYSIMNYINIYSITVTQQVIKRIYLFFLYLKKNL